MTKNVTQRKWDIKRQTGGEAKALTEKLLASTRQGSQQPSESKRLNLNRANMERESQHINQDIQDASSIYQQLPDIELAEQVLVGSILSPKDMVGSDLTYSVNDGLFDSELSGPLLKLVREHFQRHYSLDGRLDDILTRALFKHGADVYIILPENSLDQLINGQRNLSLEQYRLIEKRYQLNDHIGILGHPSRENVSLEAYRPNEHNGLNRLGGMAHLTVTDNFDVLKRVQQRDVIRKTRLRDAISRRHTNLSKAGANLRPSTEARGLTDEQIDKLYQKPDGQVNQSLTVTPTTYNNRPSVGQSMLLNPPMGSVIPVCVPGEPTNHVGYFLMIDPNTGRPIEPDADRDYLNEFKNNFSKGNQGDGGSDVLSAVKQAMGHAGTRNMKEDEFRQAYESVVENELNNRFRNGIYQESFDVKFTQEVYNIMLARAFMHQRTELVYIPEEYVVYFAFDHDERGIGRSLLKQTSLISSMRSVLLFADTMRGVRDAIGRKRATIGIPADDPDPQKTISDIQSLILENTRRGFPLGSDPAQVMDFLNMAGYDFKINVEGNNYPGTTVDFDDYQTNSSGGNTEQEDKLRRLQAAGFGLNPEQIDPTQSPDFAVGVANNNLIFTRRVIRYQQRFCLFLKKLIQTITAHSPALLEEMEKTLKDGKSKLSPTQKQAHKEDVLEKFIEAIEVSLPKPDTDQVNLQLQAFEQYTQLLDRALEAYITPEIFPDDVLSRGDGLISQIVSVLRSYFQRRWLEKNGVAPELMVLLETENNKPDFDLFDITRNMNRSLGKAIHRYADGMEKIKEANEKKYGEDEEVATGEPSDTDGGDGFGETTEETVGDEEALEGEDDAATDETEGTDEEAADPDEEVEGDDASDEDGLKGW